MLNTIMEDITLLVNEDYGDISDETVTYHKVEALFREHHTHLKGRDIKPSLLLCSLTGAINAHLPDARTQIESLSRSRAQMAGLPDTDSIHEVNTLMTDLFMYLHENQPAPDTLRADPNIAAILNMV